MKTVNKALILFNASVILAAFYSPSGGSAKLLRWLKEGKIIGIISTIIFSEVQKHQASTLIGQIFKITTAPSEKEISFYNKIVIDQGDRHVLASAKEMGVDYLVSLDKKHLLSIRHKVKDFKIVSPKELIETLEQ